jgi:hypothetical protein
MSNYRITENIEKQVVLPRRLQTIRDLYAKAGQSIGGEKRFTMVYQFETEDIHEKIFEDIARQNPKSLKYIISAIYRIKYKDDEFFMYNITRTCKNALNNPEIFSIDNYGHYKKPLVSLRWNNEKGTSIPEVTSYEHYFDSENKWNKSEVKKLLDSSTVKCENFYVGRSGIVASEPIASPYYKINNTDDFLTGSFEDLWDLGRLGLSLSDKEPSLYLIPAARKKEGENREKNVGLRDKQGLYS